MPPPQWTDQEYQEALVVAGQLDRQGHSDQAGKLRTRIQEYEAAQTAEEPPKGAMESAADVAGGWVGTGVQSGAGWTLPTERIGASIAQMVPPWLLGDQTSIERNYAGDPAASAAENIAQVGDQARAEHPWKTGLTQAASAIPSAYLMSRAGGSLLDKLPPVLNPLPRTAIAARMARAAPAVAAGGGMAAGHENAMGSATPLDTYGEKFADAFPTGAGTALATLPLFSLLGSAGGALKDMMRTGPKGRDLLAAEIAAGGEGEATSMLTGLKKNAAHKAAEESDLAAHEAGKLRYPDEPARKIAGKVSPKLQAGQEAWETATKKRIDADNASFYQSNPDQRVSIDPVRKELASYIGQREGIGSNVEGDLVPVDLPGVSNQKLKAELKKFEDLLSPNLTASEMDEALKGLDRMMYSQSGGKRAVDPGIELIAAKMREARAGFGTEWAATKDRHHGMMVEQGERRLALTGQDSPVSRDIPGQLNVISQRLGGDVSNESKLLDVADELGVLDDVKNVFGARRGEQLKYSAGSPRASASAGGVGGFFSTSVYNSLGLRADPVFRGMAKMRTMPGMVGSSVVSGQGAQDGVGMEKMQKFKRDLGTDLMNIGVQISKMKAEAEP